MLRTILQNLWHWIPTDSRFSFFVYSLCDCNFLITKTFWMSGNWFCLLTFSLKPFAMGRLIVLKEFLLSLTFSRTSFLIDCFRVKKRSFYVDRKCWYCVKELLWKWDLPLWCGYIEISVKLTTLKRWKIFEVIAFHRAEKVIAGICLEKHCFIYIYTYLKNYLILIILCIRLYI